MQHIHPRDLSPVQPSLSNQIDILISKRSLIEKNDAIALGWIQHRLHPVDPISIVGLELLVKSGEVRGSSVLNDTSSKNHVKVVGEPTLDDVRGIRAFVQRASIFLGALLDEGKGQRWRGEERRDA